MTDTTELDKAVAKQLDTLRPKRQPGYLSSEFGGLVLLGAVLVANGTKWVDIDTANLALFTGAVMAYIGGRTYAKTKEKPNA